LKLKDELAGRKVRCPGCGEPILVPDADEEADDERPTKKNRPHADNGVAAGAPKKQPPAPAEDDDEEEAPPRKKRPARDEEDELEDRPRKKKKKKKNQTVLIAVLAGVALLAFCLIGSVASYFLFIKGDKAKTGEQAKGGTTEQGKGGSTPKETVKEQGPKTTGQAPNVVIRGMELQEVKNAMKQLGLAYHNYLGTVSPKGPPNREALRDFYEKSATIDKLLKEGTVVFIWNAGIQQMPQGTSNTILAYEKDSYQGGLRVVLYGDGTVEMLDEAEFKAKPKAQGTK
jgi:hypothetical protein